ncbi:MAG TPA: hypothetical protein VJB14_07975 [Planctomycetota bacterium]|nr:hypothetical protein [Planctomycetota bacterium]
MAITAAGFIATTSQVARLGDHAATHRVDAFWDLLHKEATRVQPEFPHSGTAIAVLLEFLEEQGLHWVAADPGPDAERIHEAGLGLEFCIGPEEAMGAAAALSELHPTEAELGAFHEESAGVPLAKAGAAMSDGIDFLLRSARLLTSPDQRLLVFVR